jgi:parvulin-like peptidyl-prolyl isomerase
MMHPAKTIVCSAALLFTAAWAQAGPFPQEEAPPRSEAPPQRQAPPQTQAPPAAPEPRPVATVNGEPILDTDLQAQLQAQLQGRQVPREAVEQMRKQILDNLIEARLIEQFAREEGPDVASEEVDQVLSRFDQQLQAQGARLEDYLRMQGQTKEDLSKRVEASLAWQKYVSQKAPEDKLQQRFQQDKSHFDGTQVRARHILIALPDEADDEARQAARSRFDELQKFLNEGGEFAQAATVYSDDQATAEQGGDLGYFPRHGAVADEVAEAAFDLEPGKLSEPVKSSLGVHLVQVVDRREGDRGFEEAMPEGRNAVVGDIWEEIVSKRRPEAEIRVARPVAPQAPDQAPPRNGQAPPPNGAPR